MLSRDQLLDYIAQLESGGGRNFNHPVINHGLNRGTRAIGTYGLTAPTVNDIIKNDPRYNNLLAMDPIQKKRYIESNPTIEKDIAGREVDRLTQNSNSPEDILYRWNHGTSLNPNRINPQTLQNDKYVNDYRKLRDKLSGNQMAQANNMPKNEENLKKPTENLPTNDVATLDDILNDPLNPFSQDFNNDPEGDKMIGFNY